MDVDSSADTNFHFRYVLSPKVTPAVRAIMHSRSFGGAVEKYGDVSASGPLSENDSLLNSGTSRDSIGDLLNFHSNLNTDNTDGSENNKQANKLKASVRSEVERLHENLTVGDGIEVSPLALAVIEDISKRIRRDGGAALFIDYGETFTQSDSLRGFKKHKQVSVLSEPGLVDISADVDFSACEKVAKRIDGVSVEGAVTQREFLLRMGAVERVEHLINSVDMSDEQANEIVESFRKIVEEKEMGKRFKVIGIHNLPDGENLTGFPVQSGPNLP